jgi:Ran GTPase-activating protein (RanGAP) involved in mRNA processing and transport
MMNFADLTEIDLSNQGLDDESIDVAPLTASRVLETLIISNNQMTLANGRLTLALLAKDSLCHLDLRQNNIGPVGAANLKDVLMTSHSLRSLNLDDNMIGADGAAEIGLGLCQNRSIHSLSMNRNDIGDGGGVKMLLSSRTLVTLSLDGNDIGDNGASEIALGLMNNSILRRLDLNSNNIGVEGAKYLFSTCGFLETLSVNDNSLGPYEALVIAHCIGSCHCSLKSIYLKNNNIGDKGASFLAAVAMYYLEDLYLDGNNIGPEGAGEIARALRSNKTLQTLHLSSNQLGNESIILSMAPCLEVNETLREICLDGNGIGEDGAARLIEVIRLHNHTIRDVSISGNEVTTDTEDMLRNVLDDPIRRRNEVGWGNLCSIL